MEKNNSSKDLLSFSIMFIYIVFTILLGVFIITSIILKSFEIKIFDMLFNQFFYFSAFILMTIIYYLENDNYKSSKLIYKSNLLIKKVSHNKIFKFINYTFSIIFLALAIFKLFNELKIAL